ncbi:MAG TPA: MDR family oxidoreductase [Microbacteriaceae bacterium]|nr:MDR family oxidoreductase [Microbacteriaceae bacterium]
MSFRAIVIDDSPGAAEQDPPPAPRAPTDTSSPGQAGPGRAPSAGGASRAGRKGVSVGAGRTATLRLLPESFLTGDPAPRVAQTHERPAGRSQDDTGAAASRDPVDGACDKEGTADIDVEYSSLNYKDALALAGRPGIVAHTPLIPGIDLAGVVARSTDRRIRAGDRVVLTGAGAGERMHGGLAERARVPAGSLVCLDDAMTTRHAAAIGTAGFTAMLCVLALERGGLATTSPGKALERGGAEHDDLPILVTGATGGVGSIAVALLARLGHRVTAATGRVTEHGDYLRRLGADDVIDRSELEKPGRPLQRSRWTGVVDTAGGMILANAIAQTRYGGTVAACGLAHDRDLPASVLPFILRAVTLAGIDSVHAPLALRQEAWRRLARDLDAQLLDDMTTQVSLADVPALAESLLAGRLHGRTLVRVRETG